jgi:hypothetical protein
MAIAVLDTSVESVGHYLVSHPCVGNFTEGNYRVKLSVRSSAMTNGGIDSTFFAYFAFNERYSKWLNSNWDSLVQVTYDKLVFYLDSIVQLGKERYIEHGGFEIKDSKVYPSIINRTNPVITLTGLSHFDSAEFNLVVYSLDGRILSSRSVAVATAVDEVTHRLPDDLQPGMYVIVAQNGDSYSINSFFVK